MPANASVTHPVTILMPNLFVRSLTSWWCLLAMLIDRIDLLGLPIVSLRIVVVFPPPTHQL